MSEREFVRVELRIDDATFLRSTMLPQDKTIEQHFMMGGRECCLMVQREVMEPNDEGALTDDRDAGR